LRIETVFSFVYLPRRKLEGVIVLKFAASSSDKEIGNGRSGFLISLELLLAVRTPRPMGLVGTSREVSQFVFETQRLDLLRGVHRY